MPRITDTGLTWWLALMAALSSLSAASIMSDVLSQKGTALFIALVGSLQAGTAVVVAKVRPVQAAHDSGASEVE